MRLGEKKQLIRSHSRSSLHALPRCETHSALKSSRPQPLPWSAFSLFLPAVCPLPFIHRIPARTHPREPSRNTWIGFECPRFIAIDCGHSGNATRLPYRSIRRDNFFFFFFCHRSFRYSILSTSHRFVLVIGMEKQDVAVAHCNYYARIDDALMRDKCTSYIRRCERYREYKCHQFFVLWIILNFFSPV